MNRWAKRPKGEPPQLKAVANFFERILKHPKDRFTPFRLLQWQYDYLVNVFVKTDEDGNRYVRRSYLEIPKKNGKSEFAAGIALYMLIADGEPAAEVYLAATTKAQAEIVFRTAASMVEASPLLRSMLRVIRSTKTILSLSSYDTFLKAIAADGDAQDGINPHCVIVDELHRWKTGRSQELLNVLVKGTVTRKRPLVFEITTAGSTEDESPLAWREHERTRGIETGDFEDDSFYGKIYAADPKDNVLSPETWAKANPSMMAGGFMTPENMATLCTEAKNQPVLLNAFKRYHLGIWLSTETEYISRELWRENAGELHALTGRPCYIGLDLSETTDLTSIVLLFPEAGTEDGLETYDVLPYFWMAEDRIRERELADRVPYGQWKTEGLLETSKGSVIDLRDIKAKIKWATEIFDVREVAFDPYHATQFSVELEDELGLQRFQVPQRYSHMSEPTKKLMEFSQQKRFRHGGHKILSWNVDCLRVRGDGNDSIRPVKPKRFSTGKRIDGAVAMILALSRAMFYRPSVYESRGIMTVG